MEITEEKLYAAFGVQKDAGEKESEDADQIEEAETEAEDDQHQTDNASDDEPAEEQEPITDTEGQDEEEGQSTEERRENAARRRQAEQKAAIDAAVRAALEEQRRQYDAERAEFFQQAGVVNPFTNEPITNMDEFRAWREEQDNRKLQKELQSGKLTKETLEELIDQHPAVQAARQAQKQEAARAKQAREQAFLQNVEEQLKEIRKTDPAIQTVADLMNRPYSRAFYEAVQRGNNFLDAFYLATRGTQAEEVEEKARQSAINNLTGKNHLKATGIGGRAGATISPEEREMYRLFNPKATDQDIQKYQNKFKKG